MEVGLGLSAPVPQRCSELTGGVSSGPPTPGEPPDDPRPAHRPETPHDAVWFSGDLSREVGNAPAVDDEPRLGMPSPTSAARLTTISSGH
jgi:hypothetical protein